MTGIEVIPIEGIGEVRPGDRIAGLLSERFEFRDHDVVVVTQKIVSKAEGRLVPAPQSRSGQRQLIQSESVRVLRERGDLLITETAHGFICANSGIDYSNISAGYAALLPIDPDRSARRIRDGIRADVGVQVGVVVSDTFGRAWRRGLTDVAIGSAGIAAIVDLRGTTDHTGRELQVTEICVADEIAGAAELAMGKARSIPAAVVRGIDRTWFRESSIRTEVVRPPQEDLFR